MTELILRRDFGGNSWQERRSGDGQIDITDGILYTSASTGSQAMRDFYFHVMPGAEVEVECWAERISGDPIIAVDLTSPSGSIVSTPMRVTLVGEGLRRERHRCIVPQNTTARIARLTLGLPTASAGEARYLAPSVRMSGGVGIPQILAYGLIRLQSGVPAVHSGFRDAGIASVSFDGSTTLTVTLTTGALSSPRVAPLVFVSGTGDSPLIPLAGSVSAGSAVSFEINWTDGTAIQDVSTGTHYVFVQVVA